MLTKKVFISSERLDKVNEIFRKYVCFMIILKVTKKQGFTLSLKDTFLEKPQREVKLTPQPL